MVTLQIVLADTLWLMGLAGLLATASYLSWYRQLKQVNWLLALRAPIARLAFSLSLTLVAAGVLLRRLLTGEGAGWQMVAWGLLFFLLFIQTVLLAWAVRQGGWASSMEGD
jgi:hypothetical protein